jgi:aspartate kinase
MAAASAAAEKQLKPLFSARRIPVTGGFVAADADGETVTLGRGGSDTTAAVLGASLGADEIQIWTDVDGMMTADPRRVPGARTLETLSFVEAAELALSGARVLHPASVTPAIAASIPVRVRNSFRPEVEGTVIVKEAAVERHRPWAAMASRANVDFVTVRDPRMRADPGFLPRLLAEPSLLSGGTLWCSGGSAGMAMRGPVDEERLRGRLPDDAVLTVRRDRALVTVVGAPLAEETAGRAEVLSALADAGAEWVGIGAGGTSVSALFPGERLDETLASLHRRFFERTADG